jgi:hypothetical protein
VREKPFYLFAVSSLALHVILGGAVAIATRPSHEPASPAPPAPRAQTLAGESFEVSSEDEEAAEPVTPTSTPASPVAAPAAPAPGRTPTARPAGQPRPDVAGPAGSGRAAAAATERPLFGAVGERGVVDLATSFTRQFPQAASTDPVWASVPFGGAGELDVTITIDERGSLVDATLGSGGSAALRAGVRRTLALIRGRSFVARGAKTTLHVAAKVTPDTVHDGQHGDVFAIGAGYHEPEGSAFFALAIGRRVDVTIRAR